MNKRNPMRLDSRPALRRVERYVHDLLALVVSSGHLLAAIL